jgi:hypothetical protein
VAQSCASGEGRHLFFQALGETRFGSLRIAARRGLKKKALLHTNVSLLPISSQTPAVFADSITRTICASGTKKFAEEDTGQRQERTILEMYY